MVKLSVAPSLRTGAPRGSAATPGQGQIINSYVNLRDSAEVRRVAELAETRAPGAVLHPSHHHI